MQNHFFTVDKWTSGQMDISIVLDQQGEMVIYLYNNILYIIYYYINIMITISLIYYLDQNVHLSTCPQSFEHLNIFYSECAVISDEY